MAYGFIASWSEGVLLLIALMPILVMAQKKRSFMTAVFSVVSWNFYTAGMIHGLLRPQLLPCIKVDGVMMESSVRNSNL